MPEETLPNEEEVDEKIMDLVKKARARRKKKDEEKPEQPKPKVKHKKKAEPVSYRHRYLERRGGLVSEVPEFEEKEYEAPAFHEPKVEVAAKKPREDYEPLEYQPKILSSELEQELGLPEREESLSLAKQLENLDKAEPRACKTCGVIGSDNYYCNYCGAPFCSSCGKLLMEREGKTSEEMFTRHANLE